MDEVHWGFFIYDFMRIMEWTANGYVKIIKYIVPIHVLVQMTKKASYNFFSFKICRQVGDWLIIYAIKHENTREHVLRHLAYGVFTVTHSAIFSCSMRAERHGSQGTIFV